MKNTNNVYTKEGMIITVVVSSSRKTQIILRKKIMILPTPRFI